MILVISRYLARKGESVTAKALLLSATAMLQSLSDKKGGHADNELSKVRSNFETHPRTHKSRPLTSFHMHVVPFELFLVGDDIYMHRRRRVRGGFRSCFGAGRMRRIQTTLWTR